MIKHRILTENSKQRGWARFEPNLESGFSTTRGKGSTTLTLADIDEDGDLDLVSNRLNQTATVFENRTWTHGLLYAWPGILIKPRVIGGGNRDAFGSAIRLVYEDGGKGPAGRSRPVPAIDLKIVPHREWVGLKM